MQTAKESPTQVLTTLKFKQKKKKQKEESLKFSTYKNCTNHTQ